MPVRIRLAIKGARRNEKVSIDRSLFELGERVDQQVDVVIEELEVVGDFLVSAHGGHQDHHLAAYIGGDRIGRAQVEVGLHKDQLDAFPLHQVDQVERVGGGRRDAGFGLYVIHHVQAEVFAEIGPGAVIGCLLYTSDAAD